VSSKHTTKGWTYLVFKTRESTTTKRIGALEGPCKLLVDWGKVWHGEREDREDVGKILRH